MPLVKGATAESLASSIMTGRNASARSALQRKFCECEVFWPALTPAAGEAGKVGTTHAVPTHLRHAQFPTSAHFLPATPPWPKEPEKRGKSQPLEKNTAENRVPVRCYRGFPSLGYGRSHRSVRYEGTGGGAEERPEKQWVLLLRHSSSGANGVASG
jgi:hypothetical protein